MAIVPFDYADLSIGNYLWLPSGASILSYLLFGFKTFFGVFIEFALATIILKGSFDAVSIFSWLGRLSSSLAPIVAIMMMRFFHLSDFFDSRKVNFAHIVFLVILSSLVSTLAKFFIYPINEATISNPVVFIQSYLLGDVIGGIVFIYIAVKVFVPLMVKNKLI
jgi:hypothetical protein